VTACIFWLKNRCPSDWRDVRDCVVEHNSLDKLTSKQLLEEIKREAAEMGLTLSSPELAAEGQASTAGRPKSGSGTKH
jgi:hypothetical protein